MKHFLLLLLSIFFVGCLHSPIAMMPSSKPMAPDGYEEIGPTSDTDCLWQIFGIIPVTSGNSLQGALRGAIKRKRNEGADGLIQVTADYFYQNWLILSRTCTEVEGIAVRTAQAPASE